MTITRCTLAMGWLLVLVAFGRVQAEAPWLTVESQGMAQVPEDQSYVVAASHVLSAVPAEQLGVALLQTMYGALAELPSQD